MRIFYRVGDIYISTQGGIKWRGGNTQRTRAEASSAWQEDADVKVIATRERKWEYVELHFLFGRLETFKNLDEGSGPSLQI